MVKGEVCWRGSDDLSVVGNDIYGSWHNKCVREVGNTLQQNGVDINYSRWNLEYIL